MKQLWFIVKKDFKVSFLVLFLIACILCNNPCLAVGSVHTAGDSVLKTDQVRNLTGADGSGVIVGVISNGAKGLSDAQGLGDLPQNVVILKDGNRAEGTAMMEIIHDIAPNATLIYHDFGGGQEDKFVSAFENLINAGATIIVEDVFNYEVPYFEDGNIASGIQEILQKHPDVIIISSAGNTANAHYQGSFSDAGEGYQSFNGSTGIPVEIQSGGRLKVFLQWDDPYNGPTHDFDLFLHDTQSNSDVSIANKVQSDGGNPAEKIDYQNVGEKSQKAEIRVKLKDGETSDSNLELLLLFDPEKVTLDSKYLVPQDSIIGWAASPNIISVAAVSSSKDSIIQDFSSQGTVTISNPTNDIRKKPDITGVDDIEVSGSGDFPTTFTGTSAAAPHIAGLIAVFKSIYPDLSLEVIRDALFNSADDLGSPGWDSVYGYGLADAISMLNYLKNLGYEPVTPGENLSVTPEITPIPVITSPPESSFTITGPVILSKPGKYTISDDIIDYSPSILTITSSDVTVDGGGHTISGISIRFGTEAPVLQSGILIFSPEQNQLSNISISNVNITGTYVGISARQVDNLLVDTCGLLYNARGIDIYNSKNVLIQKSATIGNGYAGIHIDSGSQDLLIKDNVVSSNLYGIVIDGTSYAEINHNSINMNYYDGIMLDNGASSCMLTNNLCAGNKNGGISLYSSLKNEITNNTCQENNPAGVLLHESSENTITGNRFARNIRGINCYYSDTNTISGNDIVGNEATGIMLQPAGHNIVTKNRVIANTAEGILITNAVGSNQVNLIADNYLENGQNVRVQEGGNPNYQWNEQVVAGTNILGGAMKGGNAWVLPDGSGYSQTCQDKNGDGICDLPYMVITGNIDQAPLKYSGESLVPGILAQLGPVSEPITAEDWVTRGKILMGSSDYAGAISAYNHAIALSPTNYQAWRDKALSLKELGQYDAAFDTLNKILAIYPDNPELWSTAGDIYLVNLQKYAESIPFYEKAISLDDQDVHSLVNLAFALDKTGKSPEALELYRRALEINPSLTDAWNKAGNILTRAEQFDEAVRMYDKALDIDPGNAFVLNNKGYALYLAKKYPEAVESLQKAVILDPEYKAAWKNLGATFTAMGRNADAEAAYAKSG